MPVRKEQERGLKKSEGGEFSVGKIVSGLSRTMAVADQLHYAEATWLAGRGDSGLEMTFVRPSAMGREFVGLNLFGVQDVIGIKVVADKSQAADERARILGRDAELAFMIRRQHARIVILTREDLSNWWQFYEQIEDEGIYQRIGRRALEFSGLERISSERLKETRLVLERLISENKAYLGEHGTAKVRPAGDLDYAFLDEGKLRAVPLSWIKKTKMHGQIGEETIEDQAEVAGIMLPREGESKREFDARAAALEEGYFKHYGNKIRVAKASPGQVSLWRKLGFGSPRLSSYSEAELTPGDLWRHLYFGKSNLEPGPLSQVGRLTLPGLGEEFNFTGIDLVFLRRTRGGVQEYAPLDGLAALDPRALKKGRFGVVPLDNVVGIKIFPNSWSWDDMKNNDEASRRVRDAIYNMGIPGGHILYLNERLLRYWIEQGTPFTDKSNAAFSDDLQRAISYGRGLGSSNGKELYLTIDRLEPEVGGNKITTDIVDKKTANRLVILKDVGLSFNTMPEGFNGLGKVAGTADGMMSLFRHGVAPMRPGWWSLDKILQTVYNRDKKGRENGYWSITNPKLVEGDPVAQYCIQELFARMDHVELQARLPYRLFRAIMDQGGEYVKQWRKGAQVEVAAIVPTHAHLDHDGLIQYSDEKAMIIAGADQMGFWKAKTMKAVSWRGKLTTSAQLAEPRAGGRGNPYQVIERPIYPYYFSGKPVRVTDGVTLWPYIADHSLESWMQVFEYNFGGNKTVEYDSGDWRIDRNGKTLKALTGAAKHKPDVIVMETTNMGGNEKPGEGLSEEDVRDTLLHLVQEAGNEAAIVIAPPNNLQRMKSLLEVAEKTGRKLALAPAHAEVERQLMAAKELAPIGADGFDHVLPDDVGEGGWTVWRKAMTTSRKYQDDLFDIAASSPLGVLDGDRLNTEGNKWILVLSPFDILPYQLDRIGFPNGVRILYSAPFLYNWSARTLAGANLGNNSQWTQQVKAKVFMDMEIDGQGAGRVVSKRQDPKRILHVSGHPTPRQVVEALDLLIGPDRQKDVELIWKLDRYDPKDPLHSGFSMPMSGGYGVRVVLNHGLKPERVAEYLRKNLGKKR